MKSQILNLLFKTNKNYEQIAFEVGCSAKYVRALHKEAMDSTRRALKAKPVERFLGVTIKKYVNEIN